MCILFSVFPQAVLVSGLDGAGPFLALSLGLAGQESGARTGTAVAADARLLPCYRVLGLDSFRRFSFERALLLQAAA